MDSSDDECDWLVAVRGQGHVDCDRASEVGSHDGDVHGALVLGSRSRSWPVPHPSKRTRDQQLLAAALMRERALETRKKRKVEEIRDTMVRAVESISRDLSRGDINIQVKEKKKQKQLVIVTTRQHGGGVRHGLTINRVLDVAFHRIHEHLKLATIFNISATHVKRIRSAIAYAIRQKERAFLTSPEFQSQVGTRAVGDVCVPSFLVSAIAFDETQQKVKLPSEKFGEKLPPMKWSMLVTMQDMLVGAAQSDGSCGCNYIECLRPVIPLTGTTAEAVYDGLWGVPGVSVYKTLEDRAESAEGCVLVKHFDRDGAGSNDKLLTKCMMNTDDKPLNWTTDWTCGNHKNNLIEHAVGHAVHGSTMLPTMYSCALLFRMGGYFVRLLGAVARCFVRENIIVRREAPPVLSTRYAEDRRGFHPSPVRVLSFLVSPSPQK